LHIFACKYFQNQFQAAKTQLEFMNQKLFTSLMKVPEKSNVKKVVALLRNLQIFHGKLNSCWVAKTFEVEI
jgi:hypothetical protein